MLEKGEKTQLQCDARCWTRTTDAQSRATISLVSVTVSACGGLSSFDQLFQHSQNCTTFASALHPRPEPSEATTATLSTKLLFLRLRLGLWRLLLLH